MKSLATLVLVSCALIGCNRASQSQEAIRAGVIDYVATKVNIGAMEVDVTSIDFKGNPHSSIVDSAYTKVMDGDFVKVLSWYDNEWGYSNRCVDLLRLLVKKGL